MDWNRIRYHATASGLPYLARQAAAALWRRWVAHPMERRRLLSDMRQPAGPGPAARRGERWQPPQGALFTPELAGYLDQQYRSHRFDLLGSGWLDSGYDSRAPGLAGHSYRMNLDLPADQRDGAWLAMVVHAAHLPTAREYWRRVTGLDGNYRPIDWQRDRKSGFRWSAQRPWFEQETLSRGAVGADIIQAWELGRLQHLPQLALIALQYPRRRGGILREIACQLLDFAAANPPGMGVNWACTMDVAIRVANIALCHRLLTEGCPEHPPLDGWDTLIGCWLYQHGRFIRHHLEYNAGNTGNHYLANLVGLLFAATDLAPSAEIDEWRDYAVTSLAREAARQFYADGGHFEGSSNYHALCTELLAYAAALALASPAQARLPDLLFHRLTAALTLLQRLEAPGGALIQVGDNDSGRLFRLVPRGRFMSLGEAKQCYLNLAGIDGEETSSCFDEDVLWYREVADAAHRGSLTYGLLDSFSAGRFHERLAAAAAIAPDHADRQAVASPWQELPYQCETRFPADADLRQGLQVFAYPDSGLFIARSPTLFLVVCAHCNHAQKPNLSHNHNDKLAVELYLDGRPVLTDPGTYVYTPLPAERDRFRSVHAHNTLQVEGMEQNRFVSTFLTCHDARYQLLEFTDEVIAVGLSYRGVLQRRRVAIRPREVVIHDSSNRPFRQGLNDFPWESPGYGKLRRRR